MKRPVDLVQSWVRKEIRTVGAILTPYAVELRYDDEFWPSAEIVQQALDSALKIKAFIMERLDV